MATTGLCMYVPPNQQGIRPGWVDKIWVFPAQTDMLWPPAVAETPFGEAIATNMRTWRCWMNSADPDCDFGLITLDRKLSTRTARFGFGLDLAGRPSSLRFSNYSPIGTPPETQAPHIQFTGYDANNVRSWLASQIMMDARTYPSQYGAPFWNPHESGAPVLRGLLSTTVSKTQARVTRITQDEVNLYNETRAEDDVENPPKNMADVLEQTRTVEEQPSRVHTPTVARGGVLRFRYNAFNAGFAASGAITSRFYLSRTPEGMLPTVDPQLGVDTRPSLGPNTYALYEHQVTVPTTVPPEQYYLYWIMNTANPEYPGSTYCSDHPDATDCNSFGRAGAVTVTAGGGGGANVIFQNGFE